MRIERIEGSSIDRLIEGGKSSGSQSLASAINRITVLLIDDVREDWILDGEPSRGELFLEGIHLIQMVTVKRVVSYG
jgi:hypothetical protein